jgi:uncharacterized protein YggE
MIQRLLTFLFLAIAAFGQIETRPASITATATLPQTAPPDVVTFQVLLQSDFSVTAADINTALQGTMLAGATLSDVISNNIYPKGLPIPVLQWEFNMAVPVSAMKDEVTALQALHAQLSQGKIPLDVQYLVSGPQLSTQQQAQGCSLDDLFSAARAKAQQMASAANLKLGSVAALSTYLSTSIGPAAAAPYVVPACTLAVTFAVGQPAARTLTVGASRNVNVANDLVAIDARVDTAAGLALADAVAALPGTGVTAANFRNVYGSSQNGFVSGSPDGSGLEWDFLISVPFSKMKETLAALQSLQQNAQGTKGGKGPVYAISFSVAGTQPSPDLIAAQNCTNAALVSDAQAHARRVAAAAGVALGDIMSISDNSAPTAAQRIGDFTAIYAATTGLFSSSISSVLSYPQSGCYLSVQFGIQ